MSPMASSKGTFIHEEEKEEEDDGDHPMRYLPIGHVYSSSAPCVNPSGSSSVMSKKVKAQKPSGDECDDDGCGIKPPGGAKKPLLVYRRRAKKSNVDSAEGRVGSLKECFEDAHGNAIDRADGEMSFLVADCIAGEENANKRSAAKYERVRLGIAAGAPDRSSGPWLRSLEGFRSPKPTVGSKRVRSDGKNSSASSRVKKWVELEVEGANPDLLIGLACKVYWPMDDDWYKGSVTGYNSSTKEHKIEYKDGEVENLILPKEKIKFHISCKEMQQLNLKCRIPYLEKGHNYHELLSLAVNFHECQSFEPGDLVWAKITGHAMWPAVVLREPEFCSSKGLKPGRAETIFVHFFGTHDFARIKLKQAFPFLNGLLSSFHLKCKQARFYQSLDEAKLYLKDQQLPKCMLELQKNAASHDFRASSDKEGIGSGDDASADEMTNAVDLKEISPIEIGELRVTSLGKIVCDSDNFHNKKHIWPEGYTAFRKFTSMLDPSQEISYKMEVLRNPKVKSRPLFRVTPEDGEQIDGPSPSSCWKEIFNKIKEKQSSANCAEIEGSDSQKSGSYMFGFSNMQISQLIQELPNSRSCLKYFEKSRDQPTGYQAVHVNWKDLDRCNVCNMDEEYEDNLFLQCDRCRMMVHARCYGELEPLDGVLWLCNLCRPDAPKSPPKCCLCPVTGGAIKPTTDGCWAHLTCAMWIPETCLIDVKKMEPIDGISRINKDRWKLLCSICGVSYGACIQCSHNTCRVAYHPLCARAAGLCVELEDEEKSHLMSPNEDDDQCIRILSFCKKHRQPLSERPCSDNNLGLPEQLGSSYVPASNPSGCARSEPYNFTRRRGQRQPHVLAAASVKRLFVENKPYLVSGYRQNGNVCGSSISLYSHSLCAPNEQSMGEPQQEMLSNVSSMAEKYNNMKSTFRKRLAFGKSKIHGFGVFAKLAHKAGDMVIEYIGEVVRPSVADIREHRIYNFLVGAGTYMFRIDDERVIDATRAGSIAHLINHSCEPNCYSRVISVNGDAHIIIFAKRDITEWEELTYDYRFFSIDERLACYCGFPRCRGIVNDTEAEEQSAKIRVPLSELVHWNGE